MNLKVNITTIVTLCITFLVLFVMGATPLMEQPETNGPEKYALVFAIGDYPEYTGWGKINAKNDVPLILSALKKQGFKEENITVILDSMATKEGIEQSFKNHLLAKVKEGDVVVVHFSSHGQQVMDDNQDEVDGFDEAIVSYNAHLDFKKGVYEGEHHLRDDEIGELLLEVRKKLGPDGNLLTLIDACHSGTATRGIGGAARGTEKKLAPEDFDPKTDGPSARGAEQAFMEGMGTADEELAPMVTISGASADELNYETKDDEGNGVGSLSYAFSKVMVNAPGQMTYRELFDRIKVEMQKRVPNQSPQIEGTVDQELFGGAMVESQPYFMPVYWEDDRTIYLEAGTLQGLYDSSRVALFDLGAQELENADTLGLGTVVHASVAESYVVLDEPIEEERRSELKIVVDSRNFSAIKVNVKLDLNLNEETVSKIKQNITSSKAAVLVEENSDLLVTNNGVSRGGAIEVYTEHDQRLGDIILSSTDDASIDRASSAIVQEIKKYAQTRFLRTLEMEDPRRAVTMEIIPLKGEVKMGRFVQEREMTLEELTDETGNILMEEGQVFKIKFTNNGYRKAYFTVLDFTPDGSAALVIPNAASQMKAADYVLNAGQSLELDQLFVAQPPFGNEMFKLIATKDPLDLSPVIASIRGTGVRAGAPPKPDNPFQKLMENAASTTRAGTISTGSASAHTSEFSFKVVSKEE